VEKINFWKDKEKKSIDPLLFSKQAEETAKIFNQDHKDSRDKKANKRSQIRKFYDEVLRLDTIAQDRPDYWENILPQVHMLIAKAAYARGRDLVSDNFVKFIKESVEQVENRETLSVFANFFEAFMGFYKLYGPKN
jgi:CRISPR-associated protein Csm2